MVIPVKIHTGHLNPTSGQQIFQAILLFEHDINVPHERTLSLSVLNVDRIDRISDLEVVRHETAIRRVAIGIDT